MSTSAAEARFLPSAVRRHVGDPVPHVDAFGQLSEGRPGEEHDFGIEQAADSGRFRIRKRKWKPQSVQTAQTNMSSREGHCSKEEPPLRSESLAVTSCREGMWVGKPTLSYENCWASLELNGEANKHRELFRNEDELERTPHSLAASAQPASVGQGGPLHTDSQATLAASEPSSPCLPPPPDFHQPQQPPSWLLGGQ